MGSESFAIPVFQPTKYIWIIVTNSDYSERRTNPGFEDFIDLPEVNVDAENVRKGIMGLGAKKADIIEKKELDFKGFADLLFDVQTRVGINQKKGHKTLVFFYYAGHGAMTSITYAIVNQAPRVLKARYPLEQMLRSLGSIEDTYVLGVFDCCRVELAEHLRGTANDFDPDAIADH